MESLKHILVLPPVEHARRNSQRRCPGGILDRCLNHLNWVILMWKSSSSSLGPSQMAELLTLFLGERPATFQRKLFVPVISFFRSQCHSWSCCHLPHECCSLPVGWHSPDRAPLSTPPSESKKSGYSEQLHKCKRQSRPVPDSMAQGNSSLIHR